MPNASPFRTPYLYGKGFSILGLIPRLNRNFCARDPPPVALEEGHRDFDLPLPSPTSTFAGSDLGVAGRTKRHQVREIIAAALGQRFDVVYFRGRRGFAVLLTLLTEWVGSNVSVSYPFPRPAVPFPGGRISVVLFVASCFLYGVFLTEPSVR